MLEDLRIKLYDSYGFSVPLNKTDWHKVFYNNEIIPSIKELFKKYFGDSLVVGIELPFIIRNYFDEIKIPYIDIIVHPIRYMDDLAIGIRTNNVDLYKKLQTYQVNPDVFKLHAIYLKTASKVRLEQNSNNIIPNSCIIFGQTVEDMSILKKDSTLDKLSNYKDKLVEFDKKYEHVYFKPHPYNPNNSEIINFLNKHIEHFSILQNVNTYDLYSNDNVQLYTALSSGVLYEAKYFGNNVEYLFQQPFEYGEDYIGRDINSYDFEDVHVTVYKDYLTYSFWSDILSIFIQTKKKDILNNFTISNTLRYAIKATWGFNDNKSVFVENLYPLISNHKKQKNNFLEQIFSIKNSHNKKHKILTILGIKFKFKCK